MALEGRDITGAAPHAICRMGVGRSFQHTNIFRKLTVFENVQAALIAHGGQARNFWGRAEASIATRRPRCSPRSASPDRRTR